MIFSTNEISNAKILILKTIFLSIGSELIKKHLIQDDRIFFGTDWIYKLIGVAHSNYRSIRYCSKFFHNLTDII